MIQPPAASPPPTLRRALGKWDLTAFGVNIVIGGAVFLMPARVAAQVGTWSWIALAAVGLLSMCIALNFAEASSRFEGTGGAFLYTRAAFGRFASFEVGWMLWVTRVTSWSSIINGLTDALGFYWPGLRAGAPRVALISGVILTIMALNVRGIRQSAWVVNALTIGKLIPLGIFIVLGLPHVTLAAITPTGAAPTLEQAATAALFLIFAYGGYEAAPVLAGETRDPKRAVPFAMVMMIVIVTVVMTLVQVVALSTLPNLAASKTPLADAAVLFLGASGALMMTVGAAVSMTGNNVGASLSGSRSLFALAEHGDVPRIFGWVHPRFQTPAAAIIFTSLVTLTLALSGSFTTLATVSAVARLVIYVGTCASVLALRRQGPASFTIPLGPVVPVVGILASLAILYGATALQREMGAAALAIGALVFLIARALDFLIARNR